MSGLKRKAFSLADKISMLDMMKEMPAGTTKRHMAKALGIVPATVMHLLQDEDQLRAQVETGMCKTRKRRRMGNNAEMEQALIEWFRAEEAKGMRFSGKMIRAKAEDLAAEMGQSFTATDGWLYRWKIRNNIKVKKANTGNQVPEYTGMNDWFFITIPNLLKKYKPEEVYSASETGLLYRATPDGSFCFSAHEFRKSKNAVKHLTLFCCTNMTGCDKRKLFVIGKNEEKFDVWESGDSEIDKLQSVTYKSNRNAVMTASLFVNWLSDWNKQLETEQRKVVLVLDSCPSHPDGRVWKNIRLIYPPAGKTQPVLPMKAGVTKTLKTLYRRELVTAVHSSIGNKRLSSSSTTEEVGSQITLQKALRFLNACWGKVTEAVIRDSFKQCGFLTELDQSMIEWAELPECGNVEETEGGGSGSSEGANPEQQREEASTSLPAFILNGEEYDLIDEDVPCRSEELPPQSDDDQSQTEDDQEHAPPSKQNRSSLGQPPYNLRCHQDKSKPLQKDIDRSVVDAEGSSDHGDYISDTEVNMEAAVDSSPDHGVGTSKNDDSCVGDPEPIVKNKDPDSSGDGERTLSDDSRVRTDGESHPSPVSHAEAKRAIAMLYRYALQEDFGESAMLNLDNICLEVHMNSEKKA